MQRGVQNDAAKRRLQQDSPAPGSAGGATIASAATRRPRKGSSLPSACAPPSLPRPLARARKTFTCVALLAAFAGALAGCGSSSAPGTAADPADAVPASAVLYAGATVRPTGAE